MTAIIDAPTFPEFPTLVTQRLHLREACAQDAPALFSTHQDAQRMRWFGSDLLTNITEAEALIARFQANRLLPVPAVRWMLERKAQPGWIGSCGLFGWNKPWRRCVLGYEIAQVAEKQGYMKEALTAVISFGFEHMALNRIEAVIHPDNAGSIGLVRHLGFIEEARMREVAFWGEAHHDMLAFALLKRDWVQQQQAAPCAI
jgi:ribosomal-protein-alanine N-acetyltransferase